MMDDNNKNDNLDKELMEIKSWGKKLNVAPPSLVKKRWNKYNSAQLIKTFRSTAPWWGMVAALLLGVYIGRASLHWNDKNLQQDETFESVYSNY